MAERIPIAIVHGSRLIREGMRDLLGRHPGLEVRGTFSAAGEILERAPEGDHVLVYDVGTAHHEGHARIVELHERLPQARILMVNVADDDQTIIECLRMGVSGCILEDASLEELVEAIRSVWGGTPAMSSRCITSLFSYVARLQDGQPPAPSMRLTRREEQILQLVAEGMSNKEIAVKLFLQPQTVKNYVHLILQKLDVHSRLDVMRLLRSGKR